MSKWIKTLTGAYLNSSNIRAFWTSFCEEENKWYIKVNLDPVEESTKIESFDSQKQTIEALEEIINELEEEDG